MSFYKQCLALEGKPCCLTKAVSFENLIFYCEDSINSKWVKEMTRDALWINSASLSDKYYGNCIKTPGVENSPYRYPKPVTTNTGN